MRPADASRLVSLAAIWGSSFLLIKYALEGFSPVQIVAGRLVMGAGVLLALLVASGLALPRDPATWRRLAFMAVIANITPFLFIAWGEEHISSGLAAILNSTTPLFTAAMAAVVIPGERLTAVRTAGIVLGFSGVAVIVGIGGEASLTGQLAIVGAGFAYAVGFVYAKLHLTNRSDSPLRLSAAQLSLAAALSVPLAGLSAASEPPSLGWTPAAALLGLGAVGTGVAYILYYRLISDVGATTASFVTYLIPVFGVVLGWLALDESLGWNAALGALLVIGGIALAESGARQPARPPAEPAGAAGLGSE